MIVRSAVVEGRRIASVEEVRSMSITGVAVKYFLVLLLAVPLFGQQSYVSQYDVYAGYAFLNSPHVSLFENGFAAQAGVRVRRWVSIGFDYSRSTGDLKITPDLLLPSLQESLGGQLRQLAAAGRLPAGYSLVVPAHSVTQTFAFGPQLAYWKMEHATLFLRPVFAGIIHEVATPRPGDPIAAAVVAQLAPGGNKSNNVPFIGFGGGFDILFSKHVGWRTQADLVYDHLFDDLLKDGRFTVRFSTGPCFNFGRNIER
jgi:hypothetical protein